MSIGTRFLLACAVLPAILLSGAAPVPAAPASVVLTPHRAIYDLKLLRTRGRGDIEAVSGRIVYDFSGSACAGYALNFRQVSEMESTEASKIGAERPALDHLGGGRRQALPLQLGELRQRPQRRHGRGQCRARRRPRWRSSSPSRAQVFDLDRTMVFPTEQMRRIIEAARAGKTHPARCRSMTARTSGEKVFRP